MFTFNKFEWYDVLTGNCLTDITYEVTTEEGEELNDLLMEYSKIKHELKV